jgi:hypothetical protein
MSARQRTILGTVAKTPMRDLARGRLSGRLDLRRAAREADLPTTLADVVVHVAKRTRLNRLEKSDVARELAAHFRDGLDAGRAPDELIREFGDADAAAKLIRRGKKRSRNLAHKVWVRGWKAIGLTVLLMVTLYTLHAVRFHMGEPTVSTDYLAKVNAPAKAVPADERAWPLYERAFEAHVEKDTQLDVGYIRAGDERWGELVAHVRANRENLELLRQAASRKEMGYVLDVSEPRGELLSGSLLNVLLPHVGEFQNAASLLVADTRLAIHEGDTERAASNMRAFVRLARHVEEPPFLISQLVGYSILMIGMNHANEVLHESPDMLDREAWSSIAHAYAGYRGGSRVVIDFSHERFMFYDLLQRVYTDDGSGGGRLTPEGVQALGVVGAIEGEGFQFTSAPAKVIGVIASPAMDVTAAGRSATREEYDRIMRRLRLFAQEEPWDREMDEYAQRLDEKLDDFAYMARYPLIGALLPALSRTIDSGDRLTMRRDALLVAIAVELYRRDTGELPETLNRLVPDYLPSVPRDIADGRPIRYRQTGEDAYTLYSIGGDGDDDVGEPALDRHGDRIRGLGNESTDGDWVLFPPEEH